MDRHQLSESSGLDLQLWFYHTVAFVQGAILLLYQLLLMSIPGFNVLPRFHSKLLVSEVHLQLIYS